MSSQAAQDPGGSVIPAILMMMTMMMMTMMMIETGRMAIMAIIIMRKRSVPWALDFKDSEGLLLCAGGFGSSQCFLLVGWGLHPKLDPIHVGPAETHRAPSGCLSASGGTHVLSQSGSLTCNAWCPEEFRPLGAWEPCSNQVPLTCFRIAPRIPTHPYIRTS